MDEDRQLGREIDEHPTAGPAQPRPAAGTGATYSVSAARFEDALRQPEVQERLARAREILRRQRP